MGGPLVAALLGSAILPFAVPAVIRSIPGADRWWNRAEYAQMAANQAAYRQAERVAAQQYRMAANQQAFERQLAQRNLAYTRRQTIEAEAPSGLYGRRAAYRQAMQQYERP